MHADPTKHPVGFNTPKPDSGARPEFLPLVVLAFLSAIVLLWHLGTGSLLDWDEAIYAQVSKEMARSGDWFTMRWDGQLWFEKPPLLMWATALLYKLFAVNEFWARAPSALSGIGLVAVTYSIARSAYGKYVGVLSALILLSCYEFLHEARVGTTDVMLAFTVYLSVYGYVRSRSGDARWWWLVWAGFALAILVKGPAAIIVPAAVFVALLFDRQLVATLRARYFWWGLALAVLIAAPWHVVEYVRHGREFLQEYVGYHVVGRALTSLERHSYGFLYYPKLYFKRLFPWSLLLPFALVVSFWKNLRDVSRVLLLLIAATFCLYSAAQTKISWYIFPMYPATAILIAAFLGWWREAYPRLRVLVPIGSALAICVVSVFLLSPVRSARALEILDWDPLYNEPQKPIIALTRAAASRSASDVDPLVLCSDYETPFRAAAMFYADRPVRQAFFAHKPVVFGVPRYVDAQTLSDLVGVGKTRVILQKELVPAATAIFTIDPLASAGPFVYAMVERRSQSIDVNAHPSVAAILLRSLPQENDFTIALGREGVFKKFGNDHIIRAAGYRAEIVLDDKDAANSSVKLAIPANSLKVVDPTLPDATRAQVQQRMESPDLLNGVAFPEITFQSREIKSQGDGRYKVIGDLEAVGTLRPVVLDVSLVREGANYRVRGETQILLSDFWIKPPTFYSGAWKVRDEVQITFNFVLTNVPGNR